MLVVIAAAVSCLLDMLLLDVAISLATCDHLLWMNVTFKAVAGSESVACLFEFSIDVYYDVEWILGTSLESLLERKYFWCKKCVCIVIYFCVIFKIIKS